MKNITIIIPIHKISDEELSLLDKAIESAITTINGDSKVMIVGPKNVVDVTTDRYKDKYKLLFVENNESTDYCTQVNLGVSNVKTKYFSILAFDDEYSKTWFKNVERYINHKPEFSVFLPIVNIVDNQKNLLTTVNEIMWAMAFSEDQDLGVVTHEILQDYYDLSMNGAVIRTDDFIEVGKLKPSIKLSFWYEFMLRATNKDIKLMVIPKNGYYQLFGREDSILKTLEREMDGNERLFWIELAKSEYHFDKERKKEYIYKKEEVDI